MTHRFHPLSGQSVEFAQKRAEWQTAQLRPAAAPRAMMPMTSFQLDLEAETSRQFADKGHAA